MGWRDFNVFISNDKIDKIDKMVSENHIVDKVDIVGKGENENEETEPEAPMPYFDENGDLLIPFNTDQKYQWWAGGQSITETTIELKETVNA